MISYKDKKFEQNNKIATSDEFTQILMRGWF